MANRKKNDSDDLLYIFCAVGMVMFIPFIIFMVLHYKKLIREYTSSTTQRVFDIRSFFKALGGVFGITAIVTYLCLAYILELTYPYNIIFGGIYLICLIYVMYHMSLSLANTYFGVVVDSKRRKVIIPVDTANCSLTDLLALNFIRKAGSVEEISLDEIDRVTKEKGVNFYIHGVFGSRMIGFSNKQKRDECLSAIQRHTRIRSSDYGY
ncbi:hypothetical protein [Pectobacterium punjabense]|uniref:hypothetical protein n=1 Tax=Pectobacterium punjabense TaxID=2108399 RepID=UPI0019694192|nr:hypothetical protein [Pectobacterium punjabense]MBN3135197.1 hypothetical protein [Pectobacterium punjabense]MCE5379415.1 hypothetical protein [Pectobacterium punjabense]MDG0798179.1 hypothetical protein [Pectobacterium punjabense]